MCHDVLFSNYNVLFAQPLQVFDLQKLCKLDFWAGEYEWYCPLAWCYGHRESSLTLKEGTWGSDLPLITYLPKHVAGYYLQLVWFVKLDTEIFRVGEPQHLIDIWGWVLKNLVKEKIIINNSITLLHIFHLLVFILFIIMNAIVQFNSYFLTVILYI